MSGPAVEMRRTPPDREERGQGSLRVLVVTSMYPSKEHPAFGTFVKRQVDSLTSAGYSHEILFIEGWRSRFNYLKALWRVRKAVQGGGYDLIHAYYGLCGFVAAWQTKVPVVISFCGSDLNPGFAGKKRAALRSRLVIVLGRIAARRAKACVVRSREMRSRLLSPSVQRRTYIVPSGVDLELFHPEDRLDARRRLGWDAKLPIGIFVCSDAALPAVKRPELARATLAEVKKAVPEMELRIVAGKPQDELPDYYNAADVLLLTSANEGSPNVIKEALACNLPVVSTRVGDVPELLAGLKNCHVCGSDPIELASRILEVLASGERTGSRDRMAKYSLERTAGAIAGIYADVCSWAPGQKMLTSSIGESLE